VSDEVVFKERAREYLRARGTLVAPAVIHERVTSAFAALEAFLDTVPPGHEARPGPPGEWTVQEIVDHLVETHRPGLDELRCLLAGENPPGEAIPAGLQSRAPRLRPWPWLRGELQRVHGGIAEVLAAAPAGLVTDARAPLVMVVNVPRPDGSVRPLEWIEALDWKAYAIVWRLHVLDHLGQARKALAVVSA
jgi:hypothetical protein